MYSYVGNNPVNMVDPTGHFAIPAWLAAGVIGAAVGAGSVLVADLLNGGGLDTNWRYYAAAAASGAIICMTGNLVAASVASGAITAPLAMTGMVVTGYTASSAGQYIATGEINYFNAVEDGFKVGTSFGALQSLQMAMNGGYSSTLKPSGENYRTLSKEEYEAAYGNGNQTPTTQGLSRAPLTSDIGNSIYEQIDRDGNVLSRSWYDTEGFRFCRQDYNHVHDGMMPHQHDFRFWNGYMAGEEVNPLPQGY